MKNNHTLVLGCDKKHLEQLTYTWPTWVRHKPSIFKQPVIVFYDQNEVIHREVQTVVGNHAQIVPFPVNGIDFFFPYDGTRFTVSQRCRMLSGFVYVAGEHVKTSYWLKLDTDVVATGQDDWIDPEWFKSKPAIISHPWTFTKPPNQMILLDEWVKGRKGFENTKPLNLIPKPDSDRLGHKRIISWCGFFHTEFTRMCVQYAKQNDGRFHMPCPSQDGYMWWAAARLQWSIERINMKRCGWQQWNCMSNIKKHAEIAMQS